MRVLWAVAAIAVGISAPAAAADQFDLVCRGQVRGSPYASAEAYEARYRIDLVAKLWCSDACPIRIPVENVAEGRITLALHEKAFAADAYRIHYVNRLTGEWVDFDSGGAKMIGYWDAKGICQAAPFTGFPEIKTKF